MDGEDQHSGLAVLGGLGGGVALDEIRRAEFPEQEAQEQARKLDRPPAGEQLQVVFIAGHGVQGRHHGVEAAEMVDGEIPAQAHADDNDHILHCIGHGYGEHTARPRIGQRDDGRNKRRRDKVYAHGGLEDGAHCQNLYPV